MVTMRKACVVWLCVLAFLPQTAAQMCPPPGETAVCVGKAADAECMYVNRDQEFVCGTCRTHPDASCGVVCTPSGSTACTEGREAEVTCTKAATGAGGFGIAEPCQDPYIVPVASAASFAHPTTLTSSGGRLEVTLTVQQYRLDTGAFSVNVRAYCHNGVCSHPGPTMLTYPGDVVSVTLMNQLSDTEPAFDTDGTDLNAFRHANLTNVHTHGLHVDPYVDNVVLGVRPGAQKTYTYTIPADHMPGTHWYHSHMHGSSSLQVMGGLLGMWVIGVPDSLPNVQRKTFATDTALAAWEAMPVSYMTVTHFSLCTCNPTTDPFRIISYQTLRDATGDNIPMDVTLTPNPGTADQVTDLLMVNGQRQPNLAMRTGVWNRFELVNAVGDVFLEVEVRTGVAVGGGGVSACTMKLLSLDGVFLNSGIRDVTYVLMAPASRAGVAVMCESAGTFYLQSNPMTRAADHEAGFLQNLVTLSVSAGGGVDGLTTAPSWTTSDINRPAYVTDMLAATPVSTWEMGVEQTDIVGGGAWLGVGEDCTLAVTGRNGGAAPDPNSVGSCPHVAFGFPHSDTTGSALADYPYRHVGRLCDIEDVVINGRGATPHPMHVHVNHFQIVSFVSETGQDRTGEPIFSQWGEVGDWRDTMPALSGRMTVRHALDGYGGNVMVHCHFLPHEDMGMMDRFWVAGLGSDGLGADGVLPCTANGGGDTGRSVEYCNSNVPAGAFLDNYPQVAGTCPYYRQSVHQAVLSTDTPVPVPAAAPTAVPTTVPTAVPTAAPTDVPTPVPTTAEPTALPQGGTIAPKTSSPPTAAPTSLAPDASTDAPDVANTVAPETDAPLTTVPESAQPTAATSSPLTVAPSTTAPATRVPTTSAPSTPATSSAPTTSTPETHVPPTQLPSTMTPPSEMWCQSHSDCRKLDDPMATCVAYKCACSEGFVNPVHDVTQEHMHICVAPSKRGDAKLRMTWPVPCDQANQDVTRDMASAIQRVLGCRVAKLTVSCGSTVVVADVTDAGLMDMLTKDISSEVALVLATSTAAVNAGYFVPAEVGNSIVDSFRCSVEGATEVLLLHNVCTPYACEPGRTLSEGVCTGEYSSDGVSVGVIAAIISCTALLLCIVALAVYCIAKRMRTDVHTAKSEPSNGQTNRDAVV